MRKPAVIAHRAGPDGRYPENSIAAVDAAMKLGVDGIEIDVRRSADGHYVVVHDADLPKRGAVAELPASKLRDLPALDEFLAHATRGLVFLDIKVPAPIRELVSIATRRIPRDRLIFGSFWHPFIRELKQREPSLRAAATLEARLVDPVRAARDSKADILAIHDRYIDSATVRAAHAAGVEIYPWTVNAPADIRRLQSLRVDAIITDFPSRLTAS
jgi:glycerophosphoryl diester phosphodiesterase